MTTESSAEKISLKQRLTSKLACIIYGLLAGMLLLLAIRFASYHPAHTHYHANLAVYLNGERETFASPSYYEDVANCNAYEQMTPLHRTHMHNNVNDVVHVHDKAVTWGQFFTNLGWTLGDDFIKTRDTMYQANGSEKLHLVLNGQNYTGLTSLANEVIGDEDKLLVSFGEINKTTLQKQFDQIKASAHSHNELQDPASCSGSHDAGLSERLKHLF